MNKSLPVWFFLLCAFVGALLTVVFGWSIKSTLSGSDRSGRFGQAAVTIASFPTVAYDVFKEIWADADEPIRVPRTRADLSEFTAIPAIPNIDVRGLLARANKVAMASATGWRVIVGAFVINGEPRNAAIALSPKLQIRKVWILTEDEIEGLEPQAPHRKFVHGFAILRDGSVIFSFDGGVSLQRVDWCGERVWAIPGRFHHTVTLADNEEFLWTLSYVDQESPIGQILKVKTANGEIVRQFSVADIIAANPEIDILGIRQEDDNDLGGNSRNTLDQWLRDPVHLNDVEPLPASLADRFDNFRAGDLLISSRSLNLIFVLDPVSLEVKWWRTGLTRRQHDPDWSPTGGITVYDNRMGRDYSRVISIDPKSHRTQVIVDGRVNNFYSRIRGKHQFTGTGNLIVTSSQQGRVFEIDRNGNVILEIINSKFGDEDFNYSVSEAIWLPGDHLIKAEGVRCGN